MQKTVGCHVLFNCYVINSVRSFKSGDWKEGKRRKENTVLHTIKY